MIAELHKATYDSPYCESQVATRMATSPHPPGRISGGAGLSAFSDPFD